MAGQAKGITLGHIVRAALPSCSQAERLLAHQGKGLHAIAACHTPALGGYRYRCAHCGKDHFVPHSCNDRHCPSRQNLTDHDHPHCVVTGGGLALGARSWASIGPKGLFPVRALSGVFRAKFRDGLRQLFDPSQLQFPSSEPRLHQPAVFNRRLRLLGRPQWVSYSKRPFAGPQAVRA